MLSFYNKIKSPRKSPRKSPKKRSAKKSKLISPRKVDRESPVSGLAVSRCLSPKHSMTEVKKLKEINSSDLASSSAKGNDFSSAIKDFQAKWGLAKPLNNTTTHTKTQKLIQALQQRSEKEFEYRVKMKFLKHWSRSKDAYTNWKRDISNSHKHSDYSLPEANVREEKCLKEPYSSNIRPRRKLVISSDRSLNCGSKQKKKRIKFSVNDCVDSYSSVKKGQTRQSSNSLTLRSSSLNSRGCAKSYKQFFLPLVCPQNQKSKLPQLNVQSMVRVNMKKRV